MAFTLDDIRTAAEQSVESALDRDMQICAVPSPTYGERERSEFVGTIRRCCSGRTTSGAECRRSKPDVRSFGI
jgi:hypothetical protein